MARSSISNANLTNAEIQAQQLALVDLLFGGGGATSTGGTSGGGTSSTSSSPTTTSGTPIEIQLLLSAIPIVDDGQVIRSEHHNLIRAALFAIAARLGVTLGSTGPTDKTLTIIPVFQHGLYTDWLVGFGVASVVPGGVTTHGWLSVELPDGALIKSMTVIGRRDSAVTTFSVTLERHELTRHDLTGEDYEPIITADLRNAQSTFEVTTSFSGTPGLNEVDNSTYGYIIEAIVTRGESEYPVQIYAIQIVYTTS